MKYPTFKFQPDCVTEAMAGVDIFDFLIADERVSFATKVELIRMKQAFHANVLDTKGDKP